VSLVVVEDDDGEVLGVSACGESRDDDVDDSVGEVRSFFVAPGRWRAGVGRKLMEGAPRLAARARLRDRDRLVVQGQRARERLLRAARLRARRRRGADRRDLGVPPRYPLPP
jgi:GNAT superfamily N-acetyltransferase